MRPALRALLFSGGAFNPLDLFAGGYTGFYFDFSKTDRTFQESTGPTLADDATEPVGLALSERLWGGKTFAEVMATQTPVFSDDFSSYADTAALQAVWTGFGNTIALSSGRMLVTASVSGNFSVVSVPTTVGKWYNVSALASAGTIVGSTYRLFASNNSNGSGSFALSPFFAAGPLSLIFMATAATTYIVYRHEASSGTYYLDDFNVKEIPGNHAVQSLATGRRPTRQAGGVLRFDGVDDFLRTSMLPNAAMSLFFKGNVTSGGKVIFSSRTTSADDVELLVRSANGELAADIAGVFLDSLTDIRGITGVYGLTVDASLSRLWIGVTKVAESASSGTINTTVPIDIGGRSTSGTSSLNADADIEKAFAINRALTPSEIASLVNSWS